MILFIGENNQPGGGSVSYRSHKARQVGSTPAFRHQGVWQSSNAPVCRTGSGNRIGGANPSAPTQKYENIDDIPGSANGRRTGPEPVNGGPIPSPGTHGDVGVTGCTLVCGTNREGSSPSHHTMDI